MEASDVLQHLLVQRQVGDHLLQPLFLVFQLLQTLHFGGHQAAVRLVPIVIGGRAEAAFRQTSATATPSSPCFRIKAICCSLNLDFFIGHAPLGQAV